MLLAGIDPLFVQAAHELTESGRVNLMRGIARAARNLVPNPWVRAADWIEQNLVIPNGSRPGPVVLDPIQKAICDAIQDDGVTHVLWLKPPRSGSMTLTACLVIWKAAYEGHDTIVYERGDRDAQDFHDKKLRPILEASTAIAHFLRPDSRSGIQDSWTDIYGTNGAAMQQRGVQSDSNFKAMRFFAAAMKTRAQIYRNTSEVAAANRVWRAHLDCQLALGLWAPARPEDLRDAYQVGWVWPVVQSAALTQELGVMMTAAEKGHIPPGYVAQTYLGLRPEIVTRMSAAQRAQQVEVGLTVGGQFWTPGTETAQRIAAQVALEEGRERDLVEEAYAVDATPAPPDLDI